MRTKTGLSVSSGPPTPRPPQVDPLPKLWWAILIICLLAFAYRAMTTWEPSPRSTGQTTVSWELEEVSPPAYDVASGSVACGVWQCVEVTGTTVRIRLDGLCDWLPVPDQPAVYELGCREVEP